MAKKAPPLSWNEKGQLSLSIYLKKTKSSGAIAVFSKYGEILWQHGKWKTKDWTSIGSLIAAVKSATQGLNEIVGAKSNVIYFGAPQQGLWLTWDKSPWIVVGFKAQHKEALLKDIFKVLKSAPQHESVKSAHELAGLSAEGLEATLTKGLE